MLQYVPPVTFVDTPEKMMRVVRHVRDTRCAALDTETSGLDRARDVVKLWSLCPSADTRYCITKEMLSIYDKELALDQNITWYFTNQTFDMCMLDNSMHEVPIGPCYDTLAMDWLNNENKRHGLKETAWEYLGYRMPSFKDTFPSRKRGESIADRIERGLTEEPEKTYDYASSDAWATFRVFEYLKGKLESQHSTKGMNYWDYFKRVEMPFTRVLFNLIRRGIMIDAGYLMDLKPLVGGRIEKLQREINRLAGRQVNPNSPKQLIELLFGTLKHKPITYTSGGESGNRQPSTDEGTLQILADAGCAMSKLLLEYRSLNKFLGTYVEGMSKWIDSHLRIHPTLTQHVTVTGRLSSVDPNLQNLPRPEGDDFLIRDAFIPRPGYAFVVADYEQLEMRIMAHFCLHRHTTISSPTNKGQLTIGQIVNDRWSGGVYSYDFKTGKKVIKNVVDHFRNGLPADKAPYRGHLSAEDWVILRHEGAPGRKLVITEEHHVYTPNGKLPVSSLRVGDQIYYEEPALEGVPKQVLLGSLFGDGGFKRAKSSTGAGYFHSAAFYHGVAQKDYFDFKRHVLGPFVHSYTFDGKMHRGKIAASFQIERLKALMCEKRIGKKSKRPTIAALTELEVQGLTIWYLDDGSLGKDIRCTAKRGFSASISNSRLTEKEIQFINKKFSLGFKRWSRGMGLSGDNASQFFAKIARFVPPCMDYKLPAHYRGKYDPRVWKTQIQDIVPVRIIEKRKGDAKKDALSFGSGSKYDITVADTHNYFAQGVLVSNSGDQNMQKVIWDGKDIHTGTASLMFGHAYDDIKAATKKKKKAAQDPSIKLSELEKKMCFSRTASKEIGFGLNYGEGPKKLAAKLGVPVEQAKELIELYFKPYPKVREHIEWTHKQARTGIIETILGRPRRLPELIHLGEYGYWDLSQAERIAVSRAERQSTNSEIQGSAADVARMAMIRCEHDIDLQDLGVEMLLQIHDELIFEVPEENIRAALPLIREDMEHPFDFELDVPLQIDVGTGQSWASAKA